VAKVQVGGSLIALVREIESNRLAVRPNTVWRLNLQRRCSSRMALKNAISIDFHQITLPTSLDCFPQARRFSLHSVLAHLESPGRSFLG
jgi:hypothetical protein